jgi:hypothetical protein
VSADLGILVLVHTKRCCLVTTIPPFVDLSRCHSRDHEPSRGHDAAVSAILTLRLRTCCATDMPVGWAVIAARCHTPPVNFDNEHRTEAGRADRLNGEEVTDQRPASQGSEELG